MVFGIKNSLGLVAVFIKPSPGHLLLAAPSNAHWSVRRITGNVHIVSAPGSFRRAWARGHVPPLPSKNLLLGISGQLNADSDPHIAEDRLKHLIVVGKVHFGKSLDLVLFLTDFPTLRTPNLKRIENNQTSVLAAGLLEILSGNIFVLDHEHRALFDIFESQCLMSSSGDYAVAEGIVGKHGCRNARMSRIKIIRTGQRGRGLEQDGKFEVSGVLFCSGFP